METIIIILLASFLVAFICAWMSIIIRYDRAENGRVKQLLARLHEETRRHHEARAELRDVKKGWEDTYNTLRELLAFNPHRRKCQDCEQAVSHCKKLECYGGDYVCVHDPEERL